MEKFVLFVHEKFGEIRTIQIEGKTFFAAMDVASGLGYSNPHAAILRHCKGLTKREVLSNGGVQLMNYIPEGDIYRLTIKSKLPGADKFETWIFDEVIPTIRETGGYPGAATLEKINQIIEQQLVINNLLLEGINKQNLLNIGNIESLNDKECRRIIYVLTKRAMILLNGRGSNACSDAPTRKAIFSTLHIQLQERFDVADYKGIRREHFDSAVEFIKECCPSEELAYQIQMMNAAIKKAK
jgi:prophage antirepressor-like protein